MKILADPLGCDVLRCKPRVLVDQFVLDVLLSRDAKGLACAPLPRCNLITLKGGDRGIDFDDDFQVLVPGIGKRLWSYAALLPTNTALGARQARNRVRLTGRKALYDGRNFSLGNGREGHDTRLRVRNAEITRPASLDFERKTLILGHVAALNIIQRDRQAVLAGAELGPSERITNQ